MKTLRELYNLEPNITELHAQPDSNDIVPVFGTIDRVDSWKLSQKNGIHYECHFNW
jgi:hypothetical protein